MSKKNNSILSPLAIATIIALSVIVVGVLGYNMFGSDNTVYVVSIGEHPAELSLPANWVAHLWIENGEPRMAITDGTHISNEWKVKNGQTIEGSAGGGWKEAWRVQITGVTHSDNQYSIQFTFHDIHYA